MIEFLKKELLVVEESINYMEESDTALHVTYTKLCKKRRILKNTIRKLEKLEEDYR